jgi:hypothetical protein
MNTVDLLIGGKGGPLEVRLLGGNLMRLTRTVWRPSITIAPVTIHHHV